MQESDNMNICRDILDTSQLCLEGDFEEQVNQLLTTVRLSRNEVEELERLLSDVSNTLSRAWPGCKVYPFGSIVTGLGIRTSDIDCYVSLPRWVKTPQNKLVFKAKHFLMAEPSIFAELLAIGAAKVPIVKFYHIPTQRHCDINFKSPAGVQNSKLLAALLHTDPRVLPLAVLIKYWSKVHNLTGTHLMPNYALSLLVVFYLQSLSILPSVHLMQQSAARQYMVEGWNSAFEDVHYNSNEGDRSLSLYQLLGGFFDFYCHFDFENQVISIFYGRPLHKNCFKDFELLPKEFGLYKHNIFNGISRQLKLDTLMCVQDPFDLSRNCTVCVHQKLYDKVMKYFKDTAKLFYEEHSENFLKAILKKVEYKDAVHIPITLPTAGQPSKVQKRKNKKKNVQNIQNVRILYSQFRKNQKKPNNFTNR
uniref:Uncharacterized protein n=1 Tax=Pectinophora gossypiella TaxID=13191 RepID=A0A1E1WRX3_PECGO